MGDRAAPELWTHVLDGLLIAAAGVAALLVLQPLDDTPFIDDWAYAWSVERLLGQGELRVLEWSSNWNLAQVLWGALFCLPFGFSFTALRASTWVLAVAGAIGLYTLLRDLGVTRRAALLGAASLGANPIYVILGLSFMTDVPFVAVVLWASVASVRALDTGSRAGLFAAVGLSAVACAIRFVGVALPGALALAFLAPGGRRRPRPGSALLALAPLLVLGVIALGRAEIVVPSADVSLVPSAPQNRWAVLPLVVPSLPRTVPMTVDFAAGAIGVGLLPLTAAALGSGRLGRAAVFTALLGLVLAGTLLAGLPGAPPLFGEATWRIDELGATAPLIAGYERPGTPAWAWAGAVLAIASSGVWLAWAWHRPRRPGERFLAWLLAASLGLILALWLFYDRYGLVLVPLAVALFLTSGVRLRAAVAGGLIGVLAVLSLAGVHDHLALSRALWGGVDWLRARGVAPAEIDGGYVVNGWLHYAHPEHAPRDARGEPFVPDLTVSRGGLRYQLALGELEGWRVRATLPYERWLGASGAILVLERRQAPAGG